MACAAVGALLGGMGGYFTVAPASAHTVGATAQDTPLADAINGAAAHSGQGGPRVGRQRPGHPGRRGGLPDQGHLDFSVFSADPSCQRCRRGAAGSGSSGGAGARGSGGAGSGGSGGSGAGCASGDAGLASLIDNVTCTLAGIGSLPGSGTAGLSSLGALVGQVTEHPLGSERPDGFARHVDRLAPAERLRRQWRVGPALHRLADRRRQHGDGEQQTGVTGKAGSSLPLPTSGRGSGSGSSPTLPSLPVTTTDPARTAGCGCRPRRSARPAGRRRSPSRRRRCPSRVGTTITIGGVSVGVNTGGSSPGATLNLP